MAINAKNEKASDTLAFCCNSFEVQP